MKSFLVHPVSYLNGEIVLLGDKSIAHRYVIVSAIAEGKTTIENFPANKDCLYTVKALKKLGIKIKLIKSRRPKKFPVITVCGKGLYGLSRPKGPIFVGDSGTTLRLLLGVLAGQNFEVRLITGKSLSRRPMLRVSGPLRMMGAVINSILNTQYSKQEEYSPISIWGGNLRPISYRMPVASAQVKSAILFAGLYTRGVTSVIEPIRTRDHTERILKAFKADIKLKANTIVIKGGQKLVSPGRLYVPGDISSASFFMVAAATLFNSELLIKNVSLNPSRMGIIKVLKRMGADIQASSIEHQASSFEPMGNILVRGSKLKGTIVKKGEIPSLIDELPILMVAACFTQGRTIFKGVGELRVKETDRIRSMSENLRKMGANIEVIKAGQAENIIIRGVKQLRGTRVKSFGDHRTAMSMIVAGLGAKGKTSIDDITCISKSFPEFLPRLNKVIC